MCVCVCVSKLSHNTLVGRYVEKHYKRVQTMHEEDSSDEEEDDDEEEGEEEEDGEEGGEGEEQE